LAARDGGLAESDLTGGMEKTKDAAGVAQVSTVHVDNYSWDNGRRTDRKLRALRLAYLIAAP
jgi:hypothetical protein